LTGENDKYNDSKAVHLYSAFSDISLSAKYYKIASALTAHRFNNLRLQIPSKL